jgi:DNA (cytosine-5)-methyltransferase 1
MKEDGNESNGRGRKFPWRPLREKTFAEFFAGIGLMRLGLNQEGWTASFANDICEDKYRMYRTHFDDSENVFAVDDVHNINASKVPSVSLATASFPCNDLSLAGMRQGLAGQQSSAFWGFIRALEEMGPRRPLIVLLENVAGFLTSHGGEDFHAALSALNRLGYAVDALIIDAERFVPQSRVRLFVVGVFREKSHDPHVQENPGFYECEVRPRPLADFIFAHSDRIDWALRTLPKLPKRTIVLADVLEDLPEASPFWWDESRTQYLAGQMSEKHATTLESMRRARKWSYGTVFRRVRNGRSMAELRNDGIAGCLRTPRGGSGRQILIKAGYGKLKVRLLTPRECARLMGADAYRIDTPLNQALFGFGDAVCVPVISWLARHYLNPVLDELAGADIPKGKTQCLSRTA